MASTIGAQAKINGAKQFQDDLKAMTARSKALDAEMKEMTNRFEKDGKAMGDDAKQRELSSKQIEAQKEKVAKLTEYLKYLEKQGEGETAQAYKLREQIAKANTELTNMEHATEGASNASSGFNLSLGKMALGVGTAVVAVKAAVGAIKSIANAATNAAKAIWNLGVESGQWADSLITLSTQTGVDVETLQEWGYAARFIDTEVSTMTKGMTKLTKAYAKGTSSKKKMVKLAKGVTVSLKDENGQIKSQSQFFLDTIDALHGMTNEAQRNKAAQEIFGKSYTDLLPLIKSGTEALREYSDEARDMGVVISGDNVTALGGFDDTMQRLGATFDSLKTNLATLFLPILQTVGERLTTFFGTVSKAISDGLQEEDVDTIVNAFFGMFDTEMTDDGRHNLTMGQFIVKLVSKFGEKLTENKETIKAKAGQIWEYLKEKFNEIRNDPAVQEALSSIGSTLGEAIVTGIKNGIKNGIKSLFSFSTSGISNPAMARAVGMSNAQTGVLTGVFADEETVKGWGKDASSAYIEGLKTQSGPYEAEAKSYADALEKYLKTGVKTYDWGAEVGSGYADGMTSAQPEVDAAAQAEIDAVEEHTGPSAHSKSTHWGEEIGNGLASGMESALPRVSRAASKLAAAASGPIHFSKPDYGPLRNIGAWGGEMIEQYVAGIRANAWKVSNAIGSTLGVPSVSPVAGGSTTNLGGVTIIVNGAEGQDVNALADAVMAKMQSAVSRREAVFA